MAKTLHTTTYVDTFIQVAPDCPVDVAVVPPLRAGKVTVAGLQHAMIVMAPYVHTSDEVIFAASTAGRLFGGEVSDLERRAAFETYFSKGQACLRASPLPKRFGWGVHADSAGRIALCPVGSERYRQLANDPRVKQLQAMRSKRV
jgi:hypothetical protein